MKKIYQLMTTCLLFLAFTQNVQSQKGLLGPGVTIFGPTNSTAGATVSYVVFAPGITINSAYWSVSSGGTIVGLSDFYNVSVRWNTAGTHTLYYNVTNSTEGAFQQSITITATGGSIPNAPPAPVVISAGCSNATLSISGTPPLGDTWYWQGTNANGISTLSPTTNNYITTVTGNHYVRAYNASSGQWSASSSVNVLFEIPVWYPDTDGDGLGSVFGSVSQCTQPVGYVSNSDDNCPNAYGTVANNGCPEQVTLSNENYIYTITPQVPVLSTSFLGGNEDAIKGVTYFDGLGRVKQTVAIRQSGVSETDIITHAEYDNFGRQKKEYLPYVTSTSDGSIKTGAKVATENFYKTAFPLDINTSLPNPFSEKEFEASPLGRVKKQSSPGYDWRLGGGHEIESHYNTNSGNEVRHYEVTTVLSSGVYIPTLVLNATASNNNGYYDAGELIKMITYDENHTSGFNHTTEEFKDAKGQVILKRTYANTDLNADGDTLDAGESQVAHDTYYVYDDFGNLSFVLSPKSEAHTDKPTTTELNELCYQYKYDSRNRLVEKKIPGKGKEYIVYDLLDRPVMTQDANQVSSREWLFTKYDKVGRIIYTGKYNHPSVLNGSAMQSYFNSVNSTAEKQYEERVSSGTGVQGSYYTNGDFPNTNIEVLTVNYYDDYNFNLAGSLPPAGVNYVYSQSSTPDVITTRTRGLSTGTKIKTLGQPKWTTTVIYYDERGRVVYTYAKNEFSNAIDIVQSKLDFVGKVLETTTSHNKTDTTQATITIVDKFTYDHAGRLVSQVQKINNGPEELIALNAYDELGQLISKKVGGVVASNVELSNGLQTIDYKYNVRGWLTHINDVDNIGSDLFTFKINYNQTSIGGSQALYNGNISETIWYTQNDVLNHTNLRSRAYSYKYDALNRIHRADFRIELLSGVYSTQNSAEYVLSNTTYDKNGNIQRLTRFGDHGYYSIDALTYTYDSGNKLMKVVDNGYTSYRDEGFKDNGSVSNDYGYDANGNLIHDYNKSILGIQYNHLNLPTHVGHAVDGNIQYTYDATGNKLRKSVYNAYPHYATTNTDYVGNYIYEDNVLQFFSHPEGYVKYENGNFDYVYQYVDHLGNVRLSYADTNGNGSISSTTEIIEESNYYPFGLKHNGYNTVISSNGNDLAQKWKFGGKEYQEEIGINWYDIKARNYDPATGRWMNLDPKAELMHDQGLYNYSFNSPILFTDPDGQLPWPITIRSFISAKTVANGSFKGDGRGASTDPSPASTSRVESSFTVDPEQGTITSKSTRSDDTVIYPKKLLRTLGHDGIAEKIAPSEMRKTPDPSMDVSVDVKTSKGIGVDFKHSAKDPITPGIVTPDLDVQASIEVIEDLEAGALNVSARFTGDGFPSTEAFITDQSGKGKVLLGAHKEKGGLGKLFGENKRPTFNVNLLITIDKDGNFTGVQHNNKTYTVEEWNKKVKKSFNN